jgi:hypothetical protein
MEIVLNRVLKTVVAGRERLQPVLDEPDLPVRDDRELPSDAEDTFFDQDLI